MSVNVNDNNNTSRLVDKYLNLSNNVNESDWERELRETGVNFSNALSNILPDLNKAWQATTATSVDMLKSVGGEDFADFLVGDYDEFMERKYKKIQELDLARKETGGIVKGIRAGGDFSDIAGGMFNAVTSLVTTMAPAVLTRGLSLVPQIAAPMVVDYNTTKAKTKYKDSDDPIRDLIEDDEVDFAVPATLGLFAASMERIGIKGITSYIAKQSFKGKGAVMLLNTASREGLTESGQFFTEQLNTNLAEGMDKGEAAWKAFQSISSDEGIESFLQGFVGGAAVGGVSRKVSRALRNDDQGSKMVMNSIRTLSALNDKKKNEKSTAGRKILDDDIAKIEAGIKNYMNDNQKVAELLGEDQKQRLEKLIDDKDALRLRVKELQQELQDGKITQQAYNGYISSESKKYTKINEAIAAVKNEVDINIAKTQRQAVDEATKIAGNEVKDIDKKQKEELLKKNGFKGQKLKDAIGTIAGVYNPNDGILYLDMETALDVGEINVAGHELLHPIFNKLIGDPAKQGKIVEDFKRQLTQAELDTMEQEMLERGYTLENGKYNTEYVNVFSDGITKGFVGFNDSVFSKVGDVITGLFKNVGFKNISFDSGRGVYNFLKAYHEGLDTGKFNEDVLKFIEKTKDIKDPLSTVQESQAPNPYNEFTAEELIEIKKSPQTTESQMRLADGALLNQFDLLALKALKYDTRKGDFKREDVLSAARAELPGIVDRFDPATAKFSTFVTNTMAPKQQQIYEEVKSLQRPGESLDAPEARQVAVEETTQEETTTKPITKLSPLSFQKVIDKDFEGDVNIKQEQLPTISHKEVAEQFGGKVSSKIFNIPEAKITDPKKNLTYAKKITDGIPENSEAGNIQQFYDISNNLEQLIKILPPENVSSQSANINKQGEIIEVSREVYGRSLGVSNRVLNYFYENVPGKRSKGLSSQVQLKKLKEKFINPTAEVIAETKKELGITPKGQLNKYNRTIGQMLKGLAKLQGELTANTIAREQISKIETKTVKPKAQILADVKAGAADIQLSESVKGFSATDIQQLGLIARSATDLGVAKELEINKITVNADNIGAVQLNLINFVKQGKIPSWVIKLSQLANFGAKYRKDKNGKKYYLLKNGKEVLKDSPAYKKALVNGDLLPEKGSLFYSSVYDPNYLRLVEVAKENDKINPKPKRVTLPKGGKINKQFINASKAQNKINMDALQSFAEILETAVHKHGMPIEYAYALISNAYSSTRGLIKIAAPFKYISQDISQGYTEEHNPPASTIGGAIAFMIKNKKVKQGFPFVRSNYYQTVIADKDDTTLNATHKQTSPVPILVESATRFTDAGIDINTIINAETGKSLAEELSVNVPSGTKMTPELIQQTKNHLIKKLNKEISNKEIKQEIKAELKINDNILQASQVNRDSFNFLTENMTVKEQLDMMKTYDKALDVARDLNAPEKGISVFDFDETLATTKSNVIVKFTDGTEQTINAAEFAEQAAELEQQGATFDFNEFNQVIDGKKGPLFDLAMRRQDKFTSKDIFILTARPQEAAVAISAFLKGMGLNIPVDNIIGLADGRPEAKANWIVGKAAEGYNNFYFADDAYKNVKVVQDVLNVIDVKGKVQQAKLQFSKSVDKEFNTILQEKTGVKQEAKFSDAAAKSRGMKSLPWYKRWFIPPSAEDFVGLLYHFTPKGKKGEQAMEFFKKTLIDPFARGFKNINAAKQVLANDFDALQKAYPNIKKLYNKDTGYNNFTNEQAIRVYLWDKNGIEIPGISKRDLKALTKIVEDNKDMKAFASKLGEISKMPDGYIKPTESWTAGTIGSDIVSISTRENRATHLKEFLDNKEVIFSKDNLNKIEAIYGTDFRSSLEDMLWRMENGSNRRTGQSKLVNGWFDWVNNSVGAIMFFNFRSAVLQTISAVNFVNWSDNNPLKAGAALANIPQYTKDFAYIFNSDMLKQRRAGLQTDVNASELADSIANKKDKVNATIAFLLKKGFLPTQMADSFAIASGGATFYRNRINTYKKQGFTGKEAESKAFKDFQEISEVSQQSSRPDLISEQQAGPLGRLILAFQNTPMQYTRLMKKAAVDLKNGRGDTKTNISKIIYYGAVQNIIFTAMQNAMFGLLFEDEEEKGDDRYDKKKARMLNSMSDTILRGVGVYGAAVSTIKNVALKFIQEEGDGRPNHTYTLIEAINLSPPIGSKARKIYTATQTYTFNKDEIKEKGFALDSPAYGAVGNVISAGTNIPTDRVYNIVNNAQAALDKNNKAWQRIAVALGWNTWDVGIERKKFEKDKKELTKSQIIRQRKINRLKKRKNK